MRKSGGKLSLSVSQVSQTGSTAFGAEGCGSQQLELLLPRLITGGRAPRSSNLPGLHNDPSATGLFWERQTGLFIGLTPFIQNASVCGWLQRRKEGSEQDEEG